MLLMELELFRHKGNETVIRTSRLARCWLSSAPLTQTGNLDGFLIGLSVSNRVPSNVFFVVVILQG